MNKSRTIFEKNENKLNKHSKKIENFGKQAEKVRDMMDAVMSYENPYKDLLEYIDEIKLVTKNIIRYNCKHYNYPYSNCVIYALGESRKDLNYHIGSQSTLFSDLLKDHKIIAKNKVKPGDIVVYYDTEHDINVADGDKDYNHIGKITEDGNVISQFGEGNLGIYKHKIPYVFSSYGDSVVFMRKI